MGYTRRWVVFDIILFKIEEKQCEIASRIRKWRPSCHKVKK